MYEYSAFQKEWPDFKNLYLCNHTPLMNETWRPLDTTTRAQIDANLYVLQFSKTESVLMVQRAFQQCFSGLIVTVIVVINNLKNQGVYVRGRIQGGYIIL